MIIRLARGKNNKPPTLTCIRDDGSVTYQAAGERFAYHDLVHYAVETTLGYPDAFFGMVARGRDLGDFGTRNGIKDTYPPNALAAEQIVGAVQLWLANPFPAADAEFARTLADAFRDQELPAPTLTLDQIAAIRTLARDLHARWENLAPGESLELVFDR